MSAVDTHLEETERERLLDEVRNHLPAFLSAATTEQPNPAGDVRDLLNLEQRDLERVVAVHVCLAEPIRAFCAALPAQLRRPTSESAHLPETTQAVRSAIAWGATIAARARGASDQSRFVTRPAERNFDSPGNRALAWLIDELDKQLRRAAPPASAVSEEAEPINWKAELSRRRAELHAARTRPWLRGVPAERPDGRGLMRLRHARSTFYARVVPDAIEALYRYAKDPTADDLVDLLCQRFFSPDRSWRLFEIVVALRLARAFADRSADGVRLRLLTNSRSRGPYATYRLEDGAEIRLYYQRWPDDMGRSLRDELKRHQGLSAGTPKPDIVVERTGDSGDAIVIEMKASHRPSYLGQGISQLLGYLMERPDFWRGRPSGWLVAPRSEAFRPVPVHDREVWLIDADDVATAAVQRLAP
ncbi:MAG TPA: hypothetical protein VEX36_02070 [Thermoleophilaceae bacterium]|nr:hypothetical protein [Thermoleophilaceae bacterium]